MSGVSVPRLSQIERGTLLPRDNELDGLTAAYDAPVTEWYSPWTLLAVEPDEVDA